MNRAARERLKWKCRRGLLELDLILQRFLERSDIGEDDRVRLDELLDLPDNDLWQIVSGRSDRFAQRHRGIVARLRAT